MSHNSLLFERLGHVARITLNRPQRANALNAAMLDEINHTLDEIEADRNIRAVIVRGQGHAFSSGFDLKEQMERRPVGVDQWQPILRKGFDTVMRFWHFPLPTIAAVRGPCLAGACELALACDLTVASDDAYFGEPELKFGAGILVKQTKRAINRAWEADNMLQALEDALDIDLAIEGAGSPDKRQFMDIARRDGLKAALAWRDARFPARTA
jgi:enoyl-CoA hydratase